MKLFPFLVHLLFIPAVILADFNPNIQMGLITASNYVGDREIAWRIKIAGERLGWNVFLDEESGNQLNYQNLDWVICMLPDNSISDLPCPNYLMVFHPFYYLDESRALRSVYERYDGYLLTINDRQTLQEGLNKKNKKFHHVKFYPTIYSVPYKKLILHDLVVMIPVWGNRLCDPKFGTLYKLLSLSGFAKFYGIHYNPNTDRQNYMGSIPFDGKSVIDILQKHGIVLVFHSEIHNNEGIPSGRIFEAAAASAVIISDDNAFVKKYFGDSVFYIDTSVSSGEDIFQQIEDHLFKIFQNPNKALKMARRAHQIFIDNFTMEKQLINLEAMHKTIINEKDN